MADERKLLIEGLLRSEEAAWREFLVRYGPLIYSVIGRFGALSEERDDLFQEVCLSIHRSLATLRSSDRLVAWIYSVTHRHAVDAVSRRRRNPASGAGADGIEPVDPAPRVDARLEEMQQAAVLLDLLDGLRPRCRQILHALYLEDPPLVYEEISRLHGIPTGSIGPTRARCLEDLRRLWEDVSGTSPAPTTADERDHLVRPGFGDRTETVAERSGETDRDDG